MKAMNLLQKYYSHEGLDTVECLKSLPDDWQVLEPNTFDLLTFLKTVFDHKLTVQENSQIGENLSSFEHAVTESKLADKKKAWVKLSAHSTCGVCKTRLSH